MGPIIKTADKNKRATIVIVITCIICWIITFFSIKILTEYSLGLFIYLPIIMGITSTILYAHKYQITKRECFNVTLIAFGVFCFGLLLFAFEGIICILMAAPIGLAGIWFGNEIGYAIVKSKRIGNPPTIMIVLILSVPALMAFESTLKDKEEIRPVITSIEINASPEIVWKNVVEFPKLDEPTEIVFKTGIAYPISAEINGKGVGAIRNCNFSTGSFVEPITVWDEPNLLKFDVKDQPEPMKELSFYDIHPNHLHGYFVSKQGQFKLTALPNGHTLLEGTTWYVNKIKPNFYWNIWSDYLIHKIHTRVLEHIKRNAEKNSSPAITNH